MANNRKFHFTIGNPIVFFTTIIIVIFGSLMVVSAEMGNAVGDNKYLSTELLTQIGYSLIGILCLLLVTNLHIIKWSKKIYYVGYCVVLAMLLVTRLFGEINGAYAWISIGPVSIQPSEIAKTFMIAFGAKLLGEQAGDKILVNFKRYAAMSLFYFLIIFLYQGDFGSAVVLFVICYCVALVPNNVELRKYQFYMFVGIFAAIGLMIFLLSDPVTKFMMNHSDNYMIGRFLAAANPFLYQYDYGYHLIMSLACFATGGVFGLGYGNSIHKYMNFPNPSSDFILPVIVEETGIIGFSILMVLYFVVLITLVVNSFKVNQVQDKIVLLGTFLYFIVHFILNVGGVSGLIPLTGVPLLLISSGGSSMVMSLAALGLSQSVLVKNNENHFRKIQKDTNQNA